jgi:battenin
MTLTVLLTLMTLITTLTTLLINSRFHKVSYRVRVLAATALMVLSFLCITVGTLPVALTEAAAARQEDRGVFWLQILGVLAASLQSGLGEASFLALAGRYGQQKRTMLTMWSSGTGFAGVFGFAWVELFSGFFGLTFAGTCVVPITRSFLSVLRFTCVGASNA